LASGDQWPTAFYYRLKKTKITHCQNGSKIQSENKNSLICRFIFSDEKNTYQRRIIIPAEDLLPGTMSKEEVRPTTPGLPGMLTVCFNMNTI